MYIRPRKAIHNRLSRVLSIIDESIMLLEASPIKEFQKAVEGGSKSIVTLDAEGYELVQQAIAIYNKGAIDKAEYDPYSVQFKKDGKIDAKFWAQEVIHASKAQAVMQKRVKTRHEHNQKMENIYQHVVVDNDDVCVLNILSAPQLYKVVHGRVGLQVCEDYKEKYSGKEEIKVNAASFKKMAHEEALGYLNDAPWIMTPSWCIAASGGQKYWVSDSYGLYRGKKPKVFYIYSKKHVNWRFALVMNDKGIEEFRDPWQTGGTDGSSKIIAGRWLYEDTIGQSFPLNRLMEAVDGYRESCLNGENTFVEDARNENQRIYELFMFLTTVNDHKPSDVDDLVRNGFDINFELSPFINSDKGAIEVATSKGDIKTFACPKFDYEYTNDEGNKSTWTTIVPATVFGWLMLSQKGLNDIAVNKDDESPEAQEALIMLQKCLENGGDPSGELFVNGIGGNKFTFYDMIELSDNQIVMDSIVRYVKKKRPTAWGTLLKRVTFSDSHKSRRYLDDMHEGYGGGKRSLMGKEKGDKPALYVRRDWHDGSVPVKSFMQIVSFFDPSTRGYLEAAIDEAEAKGNVKSLRNYALSKFIDLFDPYQTPFITIENENTVDDIADIFGMLLEHGVFEASNFADIVHTAIAVTKYASGITNIDGFQYRLMFIKKVYDKLVSVCQELGISPSELTKTATPLDDYKFTKSVSLEFYDGIYDAMESYIESVYKHFAEIERKQQGFLTPVQFQYFKNIFTGQTIVDGDDSFSSTWEFIQPSDNSTAFNFIETAKLFNLQDRVKQKLDEVCGKFTVSDDSLVAHFQNGNWGKISTMIVKNELDFKQFDETQITLSNGRTAPISELLFDVETIVEEGYMEKCGDNIENVSHAYSVVVYKYVVNKQLTISALDSLVLSGGFTFASARTTDLDAHYNSSAVAEMNLERGASFTTSGGYLYHLLDLFINHENKIIKNMASSALCILLHVYIDNDVPKQRQLLFKPSKSNGMSFYGTLIATAQGWLLGRTCNYSNNGFRYIKPKENILGKPVPHAILEHLGLSFFRDYCDIISGKSALRTEVATIKDSNGKTVVDVLNEMRELNKNGELDSSELSDWMFRRCLEKLYV